MIAKKNFTRIILTAILFFSIAIIEAQPYPVVITVAVSPPYTTKLDDYISQPNKIMATLINTSTNTPVYVNVQGMISGDNGVKVYSDPSFKMPQPIILQPGIPYQINQSNLTQIFNADQLVFEGVTKKELMYGNGIPEGDYTICLRAFDYNTGQPLSQDEPSGCSNHFIIADIEPPVILSPVCGDEVEAKVPQTMLITWSRSPGSPIRTLYDIKVIEVLPSDRNINDAMQTSIHPVFLEKTVRVTSYMITPADPAMIPGKTYAIMVTAYDPDKRILFRNKGMSEVCSYRYKPAKDLIPKDTLDNNRKK